MPSRTSTDKLADPESPKAERRERRRHHKPGRSKRADREAGDSAEALDGAGAPPRRKSSSAAVPELQRRATSADSPSASRSSLPYPSFSKAHSREAVSSRDNLATPPRRGIFTPDSTDLQQRRDSPKTAAGRHSAPAMNGPPSPPLTADDHAAQLDEKRRNVGLGGGASRNASQTKLDADPMRTKSPGTASPPPTSTSPLRSAKIRTATPRSSLRQARSATPTKGPKVATVDDGSSLLSSKRPSRSTSPASSSRTSIAPQQPKLQTPFSPIPDEDTSPFDDADTTPRSPTPRGTPFSAAGRQGPARTASATNGDSPMPPPPPPPPAVPFTAPRVDYLMLHGGLVHAVPKHFLAAPEPSHQQEFMVGELPDPTTTAAQAQRFFGPFSKLLDDYSKVMSKSGSVAVATGYRSIARRLLDRLEAVFSRDISSETCVCLMCEGAANQIELQQETGVSWGEILEYVSGRQELPQWPPFAIHQSEVGLGISAEEYKAPMQKLDIDVPEEYREHYIRQSKKTKIQVDRWLSRQDTDTDGPPDEADDDTLTFAILTHLGPDERRLFSQLLGVSQSRPPSIHPGSRTQTPLNAPRSPLLQQTGLALQRLYRLPNIPRSPESAVFLVKNHCLHNVLATLAAISDGEWDILTSGRFDGFLRSGADEGGATSAAPSRGPTPASSAPPSRSVSGTLFPGMPLPGATPSLATAGAPVALDEETEIAALAEVEREIFLGMETLEDAFEALHVRAEAVRRALRERGAGLAMAAQARKGPAANVVEARLGTPASARGWDDSETDDGIDDAASELAPDDSASNVSRARYRRPKRRTERRTPAPVEEEDEGPAQAQAKVAAAPARVSWSRNSLRKARP